MDDDVAIVQQNPLGLALTLRPERFDPRHFIESLFDVLRERLDMRTRDSRGYDKDVRQDEHFLNIEQNNVGPFSCEDGVSGHPGQFHALLYDDSSIVGWVFHPIRSSRLCVEVVVVNVAVHSIGDQKAERPVGSDHLANLGAAYLQHCHIKEDSDRQNLGDES